MERGGADNLSTRIRESSVGAASPGLAHDSTVRHDVVVENRSLFKCTLYSRLRARVSASPSHLQGLVWTEEKDARRRGRVAFREDLTVGTPTNTALLPYPRICDFHRSPPKIPVHRKARRALNSRREDRLAQATLHSRHESGREGCRRVFDPYSLGVPESGGWARHCQATTDCIAKYSTRRQPRDFQPGVAVTNSLLPESQVAIALWVVDASQIQAASWARCSGSSCYNKRSHGRLYACLR